MCIRDRAHVLRLVHHDVAEFLAFQFADPLRDQRDERRVFRGDGAPLAREGFLRGGAQLGVCLLYTSRCV